MDVTMPLDPSEFMDPHNWSTMPLIARMKPGVDVAHLEVQLDPLLDRFVATGVTERFRRRYLERVAVESAQQGISDLREQFSRPLRLLMVAVAVLMLIACVNLAGLLVARNSARQHELGMRLGTFFAMVALTLAAVGVYGLLAHLVARRVPEIGVRLALGARPTDMMWMTLRENLRLALAGSAIGIATAAAGLRVLDGLLFGLSPTDAVNLASAALILVLVSLAAAVVPARRAASVDPLVALRCE
jgi:ABC-type antimicrobial peptide transport system permease subunit